MMNSFVNSVNKKSSVDDIFKNLKNELKLDKQLDSEIKTMDLKLRCIKTGKVINFDEANHDLNK
jgi:hypothetical protein